mmetsp:Transcript_22814/g.53358  ORF Transcript_22814/g.53358 Transcript_22814/m.53358 type:complete len:225 (+) Transcript_22814:328-1002(+)
MVLVITGREDTQQQVFVHHAVAATPKLYLVAAHHQTQAIHCTEVPGNVPGESRCLAAARRRMDAKQVFMALLVLLYRVGPEDVVDPLVLWAHEHVAGEWELDCLQVVELPLAVAQASVQHEDALGKEARDGQAIEAAVDELEGLGPEGGPQLLHAFVFEAVLLVHGTVLVVAPHQADPLWEQHLVCKQEPYDLELVLPPIHEVAVEDEGCLALIFWRTEDSQEK